LPTLLGRPNSFAGSSGFPIGYLLQKEFGVFSPTSEALLSISENPLPPSLNLSALGLSFSFLAKAFKRAFLVPPNRYEEIFRYLPTPLTLSSGFLNSFPPKFIRQARENFIFFLLKGYFLFVSPSAACRSALFLLVVAASFPFFCWTKLLMHVFQRTP